MILNLILILNLMNIMDITLRARIANLLVTGSRCRGGIVNILGGCTGALTVRQLPNPTALWQPRVSTSNSLSDHSRPHTHKYLRQIHRIHARRDIRGCGDDPFQPPCRQSPNPTALWLLRVSTSNSLSDHYKPHTHTHVRQIHRIHARRDIRGCGDDHLKPPRRQFPNPKPL